MSNSDVYLETVRRLEPEIAMIDPGAYYASAAISLKRIADSLEKLALTAGQTNEYGESGTAAISRAIINGLRP